MLWMCRLLPDDNNLRRKPQGDFIPSVKRKRLILAILLGIKNGDCPHLMKRVAIYDFIDPEILDSSSSPILERVPSVVRRATARDDLLYIHAT